MNTATITTGNGDIRTVTIGMFRSTGKGEILLVYLNESEADATILRFDQLSGKDRHLVHAAAQDPLSVLEQTTTASLPSRWTA